MAHDFATIIDSHNSPIPKNLSRYSSIMGATPIFSANCRSYTAKKISKNGPVFICLSKRVKM